MKGFSLHPKVYATGQADGLIRMLEEVWVRSLKPGQGTLYIISGFGTYNGGVRFFSTFKDHISKGGRVVSFFAGSTRQRLTSRQLVEELLQVGAEVNIVNRKRLLHAKCYGSTTNIGEQLIVSSGNFTGPGMSQNVEAAVILDAGMTQDIGFMWSDAERSLKQQAWNTFVPTLNNVTDTRWNLLYDEFARTVVLDDTEETTLLVTLVHSDTARIQARPGTTAGKGTQYFWLSKDSYGFFPPLTIRNQRGHKETFSCDITIHYIDLQQTHRNRVTFEAGNNVDFRLGTSKLRYTQVAEAKDLAAISRTAEDVYELRIFKHDSAEYKLLEPFAINFIGHQGKRYGYIDNEDFSRLTGVSLPFIP